MTTQNTSNTNILKDTYGFKQYIANMKLKLNASVLIDIAQELGVNIFTTNKTKKGSFKKKTKNVLIRDIVAVANDNPSVIIFNENIRNPLRIKDFFICEIEMLNFVNGSIPLKEEDFLNFTTERGVVYRDLFIYQLNLVVKDRKNGTTVSADPDENSKKIEQGIYLLSVKNSNGIWVIIKIGSFAETQGMSKRIQSFGGGNNATGSATNKWFQRAIKYFISCGLECRFTYRLKFVKNIIDDDPMYDKPEEVKPYLIRKAETRAFQVHNLLNNGNCPIFGENCM